MGVFDSAAATLKDATYRGALNTLGLMAGLSDNKLTSFVNDAMRVKDKIIVGGTDGISARKINEQGGLVRRIAAEYNAHPDVLDRLERDLGNPALKRRWDAVVNADGTERGYDVISRYIDQYTGDSTADKKPRSLNDILTNAEYDLNLKERPANVSPYKQMGLNAGLNAAQANGFAADAERFKGLITPRGTRVDAQNELLARMAQEYKQHPDVLDRLGADLRNPEMKRRWDAVVSKDGQRNGYNIVSKYLNEYTGDSADGRRDGLGTVLTAAERELGLAPNPATAAPSGKVNAPAKAPVDAPANAADDSPAVATKPAVVSQSADDGKLTQEGVVAIAGSLAGQISEMYPNDPEMAQKVEGFMKRIATDPALQGRLAKIMNDDPKIRDMFESNPGEENMFDRLKGLDPKTRKEVLEAMRTPITQLMDNPEKIGDATFMAKMQKDAEAAGKSGFLASLGETFSNLFSGDMGGIGGFLKEVFGPLIDAFKSIFNAFTGDSSALSMSNNPKAGLSRNYVTSAAISMEQLEAHYRDEANQNNIRSSGISDMSRDGKVTRADELDIKAADGSSVRALVSGGRVAMSVDGKPALTVYRIDSKTGAIGDAEPLLVTQAEIDRLDEIRRGIKPVEAPKPETQTAAANKDTPDPNKNGLAPASPAVAT